MFTFGPCMMSRMARLTKSCLDPHMLRGTTLALPSSHLPNSSFAHALRVAATSSPNDWRRHFHLSISPSAMVKVRMNLDPYFAEVGMIAEPEVPQPFSLSSLLTLEGWKGVKDFGQRKVRNFYFKGKVKKEGKNMSDFSYPLFRQIVTSSFIAYNQALVKGDWAELRDIVGEKMLSKLKNDEKIAKMREASKRFTIDWQGEVTSVDIHSAALIPIEDISSTFAQIKVRVNSKQQLRILDKKTGNQVAGQTEMKDTEEWFVYERAISREFSQWKIVARLPLDEEKK